MDPVKLIKAGQRGAGKAIARADALADAPKAYSPQVLDSTTARLAEKISNGNPKLTDEEVFKKAKAQAIRKLEWERVQKPALEERYGELGKSSFADSSTKKMQNTAEVVAERKRKANEFLNQPTPPWIAPRPELQAFDRKSIKDALGGFPDVSQSSFPRDTPARASTSHVEELYSDKGNRELIEKQIKRGLPLGGETFYASLYPVKKAVMDAGMPAEKFDKWVHSLAPASARNSIMNEMAVGQFLRNMNARGIELTEENVAREMALFKEKFGVGLPLMPIHRQGVQNVLEGGQNLRDMSQANIPTNYKIPTYGTQKAGDFAHSVVLDTHEAAGQTQGSRFHPYFNEQGGFGNAEYNVGEQGLLGIAKDMGIPGGMAQAGRWLGGGELTGLRSPRGDALDLLEKQTAYTLKEKGRQPNPTNVREEILRQIETGEGDLLPWFRKEGMPDVRETGLQRAEGGEVSLDAMRMAVDNKKAGGVAHLQAGGSKLNVLGKVGKAVGKAEAAVSARIEAAANLKKLHEDLLQQRGAGEARRLQRAADEIPNLETMYSDPALRRTFLVNRPSPLMTLNPSRFEDFAYPLTGPRLRGDPRQMSSQTFPLTEGLYDDSIKNIEYLSGIQGGFSDVPFLMVGKNPVAKYPSIDAHEGRHRSRVLSQQGRDASLIQVPPTGFIADTIPQSRSQTSEGSIEAMRAALGEQRLVTPQGTPKIPGSRMELSDDDMRRLDQLSSASHSSLSPTELDTMFSLIKKQNKMKEGAFTKIDDPDYAIELPELYKAGGAVRMADGDLVEPELSATVYRGKVGRERPESPGPSWGKVKDIGKELHSMLVEQTVEEAENAMQPGGVKNLLGRLGAATVGTPMDLVNLGLGGVDYLASADRVKAGKPDFLFKLAQEHPVGGAESLVNAMKSYGITNENETPLTDIAGQIVGGAGIAPARKGLNLLHNAATWRGTPVTATVEAVAPRGSSMSHLGQGQKKSFQDEITNRMILGDNAPVPMTTMGGLPTTRRPAQGVYLNNAGKLETNPMVAVDIPRMGSLSTNRPLRADIATAGAELGQESMAAHRFVPLLVNSPKDASAMLVKTPKGLTNEQVVALGEALPNVIVSHNPRLGGIVVMPFADDSGKLYALEHKGVKAIADRILGKDSQIKYGNADVTRDRLYLERPQYGEEGARLPSTQSTAERKRLLRGQKRVNSRG